MAGKKNIAEKKRGDFANGSLLKVWITAILIVIVTYMVFSPALKNDFTNWDDNRYVQSNPLIISPSSSLTQIMETPVAANYHPVTMLTFLWNYKNGELNPGGYILTNIILHLLNVLLVFFFVFLITRRNLLMAAFVALLFGIHPMHVESVAWISERKDLLYTFFFLAGLITYYYYRASGKFILYVATLLLFALSCLSKAMAVVFPLVMLLVDYLIGVKWSRKIWMEKIPFFIISVVIGIIAVKVQYEGKTLSEMKDLTLLERFLFACYGFLIYIVKLVIPFKLAVFYPYPVNGNGSLPLIFYLSPLIILSLFIIAYLMLRKEKMVIFGLLFYVITIALVLQFISVGDAIMADRYSYLSYVGLLIALSYFVNEAWQANHFYRYAVATVVIIAALEFGFQTFNRTMVWKNSETLWTDEINKYPGAAVAYSHRAIYFAGQQQYDKAGKDFTMAATLNPSAENLYNRGIYYCKTEQNDSALKDFTNSIQILSTDSVYNWRGVANHKLRNFSAAIVDFSKALELRPTPVYWLNRSFSENAFGKKEEAKLDAMKAKQLGLQVDVNYLKYLGID